MNLIKENKAPAHAKQLSLDVFKDKMMDDVNQEKGGSSAVCYGIGYGIGFAAGYVLGTLDSCHD